MAVHSGSFCEFDELSCVDLHRQPAPGLRGPEIPGSRHIHDRVDVHLVGAEVVAVCEAERQRALRHGNPAQEQIRDYFEHPAGCKHRSADAAHVLGGGLGAVEELVGQGGRAQRPPGRVAFHNEVSQRPAPQPVDHAAVVVAHGGHPLLVCHPHAIKVFQLARPEVCLGQLGHQAWEGGISWKVLGLDASQAPVGLEALGGPVFGLGRV
eukprot:scaffold277218_cov36-Prasinocladus_malaysianus.AAC.1